MTGYLHTERLRTLADSVLLVGITILAYNLVPPSIINGQLSEPEVQDFFNNLYALISSFVVIFILWILYMKILDYLEQPNEVITIISITFFILVLLTPVFTVGTFQYDNWRSLASLALLQIVNSLLLMALWTYILRSKLLVQQFKHEYNQSMYSNLAVIPSLYSIAVVIGFVNVDIANIFPVFMIPAILILSQVYHRKDAQ